MSSVHDGCSAHAALSLRSPGRTPSTHMVLPPQLPFRSHRGCHPRNPAPSGPVSAEHGPAARGRVDGRSGAAAPSPAPCAPPRPTPRAIPDSPKEGRKRLGSGGSPRSAPRGIAAPAESLYLAELVPLGSNCQAVVGSPMCCCFLHTVSKSTPIAPGGGSHHQLPISIRSQRGRRSSPPSYRYFRPVVV